MLNADSGRTRVALVSESRLLGTAVAGALQSRMLLPMVCPWPVRPDKTRTLLRRVGRARVAVGIILCDLDAPDRLQDVERIVFPKTVRWLVLTDSPPGPAWGAVLAAGALGVLSTDTTVEELVRAIRAAEAGRSITPEPVRERVTRQWEETSTEQRELARRLDRLTPREAEILALLYDGLSVRRIGEIFRISEATVRTHVKAIRAKLGVDTQLAAVALYRRARELLPRRET